MKILYCIHGTFNPGGMERMVVSKANALAERGNEVVILTSDQDGRPDFFPLHKAVIRLDADVMYGNTDFSGPVSKFFVRRRKMQAHKEFIKRTIKSFNPDIIISTVGNEVSFLPKLADGAATVAEIHFSRYYRLQKDRKGIWRLIDWYLTQCDRRNLSHYDRFVVLTGSDAKNWRGLNNLIVIPNFISTEPQSTTSLESKRVIAVGRLDFQKNYDAMIDVWERVHRDFPDWTLDIYGQGPDKERLEKIVSDKGLGDTINFKGITPPAGQAYSTASILLHTARYEGFALVLVEAMSFGIPVVAFDCPCGPGEIIKDSKTGFLIPPGDVAGMAEALKTLMGNPDMRSEMGANSLERSRCFSPETIIPLWESLFEELKPNRTGSF